MRPRLLPEKGLLMGSVLVVADTHIGYEVVMAREGFSLPRKTLWVASEIRRLGEENSASTLLIAGDLKHSFPPLRDEIRELKTFIEELRKTFDEIILVRGNHDVGVSWLKKLGVEVVEELELGGWKIVHGHKPVEGKRLILGHEHPTVTLADEVGARIKVPIFLAGKRTVVLPAFSPWASGNDVLRGFISPVLKERQEELRVLVPVEKELLDFGDHKALRNALIKTLKGV